MQRLVTVGLLTLGVALATPGCGGDDDGATEVGAGGAAADGEGSGEQGVGGANDDDPGAGAGGDDGQPGAGGEGAVGSGGGEDGAGGADVGSGGAPGVSGSGGVAPDMCTPTCAAGVCDVDDGCGGTCSCPEGETCGAGTCEATPAAAACGAPTGNLVGDVMPSVELMDCDGNLHDVRDLCGRDAGWLFEFAAWCPPCRQHAASINDALSGFEGEDVGMLFIISENENFGAPTQEDCRRFRDQYGLTVPVLMDTDDAFQRAFGVPPNAVNIVVDGDGAITHSQRYGSQAAVLEAIEAVLGD
jgi:peroxiredoxin